jgi:hypothetical protein
MDSVAEQISRVLGTDQDEEEEMNAPLNRSNSRNNISVDGAGPCTAPQLGRPRWPSSSVRAARRGAADAALDAARLMRCG